MVEKVYFFSKKTAFMASVYAAMRPESLFRSHCSECVSGIFT